MNTDWKRQNELVYLLNTARNEANAALQILDDGTMPPTERQKLVHMLLEFLVGPSFSPYRDES